MDFGMETRTFDRLTRLNRQNKPEKFTFFAKLTLVHRTVYRYVSVLCWLGSDKSEHETEYKR